MRMSFSGLMRRPSSMTRAMVEKMMAHSNHLYPPGPMQQQAQAQAHAAAQHSAHLQQTQVGPCHALRGALARCACVRTRTQTCIRTCTHTHARTCTSTHTHSHTHACICTHMHTYARIKTLQKGRSSNAPSTANCRAATNALKKQGIFSSMDEVLGNVMAQMNQTVRGTAEENVKVRPGRWGSVRGTAEEYVKVRPGRWGSRVQKEGFIGVCGSTGLVRSGGRPLRPLGPLQALLPSCNPLLHPPPPPCLFAPAHRPPPMAVSLHFFCAQRVKESRSAPPARAHPHNLINPDPQPLAPSPPPPPGWAAEARSAVGPGLLHVQRIAGACMSAAPCLNCCPCSWPQQELPYCLP